MPSIVSSQGESDFTPLPAGTYIGRCYQVINLGLQAAGPWEPKNKHYIGFEVPAERITWKDKEGIEHEGPAIIGARYTSSLSPKAILRQQLETWRGRVFTEAELAKFDLFNLIGAPAMISVVHSEDGKYANITGLMRLPQGMVCPPVELPPVAYDPTDPQANIAFAALTKRMQETVIRGQELAESASAAPPPMPPTPTPGHLTPSAIMPNGRGSMMAPPPQPAVPHSADFDDDIPF